MGDRVATADVRIGDRPLDVTATFSVTVNSFLAEGGGNFTVLRQGGRRTVGLVDQDAPIKDGAAAPQPVSACLEGRIR